MEVKVLCPCGAKYQFPVEPINGRMPQTVACPACGADNTEEANRVIRQQLGTPTAAPVAAPVAISAVRVAELQVATPQVAEAPPPRAARPVLTQTQARALATEGGTMATIKKVGAAALTIVLVGIGIFALYQKWSRRVGGIGHLVSAVAEAAAGDDAIGPKVHWTLPSDDGAVLLVKHGNHAEVARTFAAAYADLKKQPLKSITAKTDTDVLNEEAMFAVYPAIKGAVEISGPGDWSETEAGALAAAVSRQTTNYVVVALMGDDGESGVVSIYENGERRFRMKRWYEIKSLSEDGIKEFMERDGEAWAKTHGYVPSPVKVLSNVESDAMPFEDVNQLLLKLGFDISDRPDGVKGVIVLAK